jgi:hypothetical protein
MLKKLGMDWKSSSICKLITGSCEDGNDAQVILKVRVLNEFWVVRKDSELWDGLK